VDGLAFLTKRSGSSKERASVLTKQALFNTEFRLQAHGIKAVNGFLQSDPDPDFRVKCTRRLIIASLMNCIDNAIYWLENRGGRDKRIYVGSSFELNGRPMLLVADNGPGFQDHPGELVEPFFGRRPGGMGLGLHLASEVAKLHKGRLLFPEPSEITLPGQFTGAIVGIEFPVKA